jgi:NADH-quinone oxidoreductase subunit A
VTRGQGLFAFVELAIFVGILAVGLVYVWRKGDLQWLKRLPRRAEPSGGVRAAA